MTTIADHDAYIAAAPELFQPSLKRLRELLGRALPEAEEIVAYDMPGFSITAGAGVAEGRRGVTAHAPVGRRRPGHPYLRPRRCAG